VGIASGLLAGLACAPRSHTVRSPDATELESLRACLGPAAAAVPFAGSGRAHFESREGDVDGAVRVRVDPPRRAWVELRTGVLFGLVAERVVVSLPGDGYLLVYRQRSDDLQRLPYDSSVAAPLAPGSGSTGLLALLAGRVPWPGGKAPSDLGSRCEVSSRPGDRELACRVPVTAAGREGWFTLRVAAGRLSRLEWWEGGRRRLVVQYDRYVSLGAAWYPSRVRLQAPGEGLRAEVTLERLDARPSFEDRDFEVGRSSAGALEPLEGRAVEGR
jgi:hypothetical protein